MKRERSLSPVDVKVRRRLTSSPVPTMAGAASGRLADLDGVALAAAPFAAGAGLLGYGASYLPGIARSMYSRLPTWRTTRPIGRWRAAGKPITYSTARGVGKRTKGWTRRAVGRETPFYLGRAPPRMLTHNYDLDISPAVGLAGHVTHLNAISRGSSLTERTGSRVNLSSLHIRGTVRGDVGVNVLGVIAIIYDRSPDGALPAWTDIFDANVPETFQRLDKRDRFYVLWRRTFPCYYEGGGHGPAHMLDMRIPIHRPAQFDDTTSTGNIGDVRRGALYLYATATQDFMLVNTRTRLLFSSV